MSAKPQPISIWQPEHHDGQLFFVRPQPPAYGDHYATRLVLPASAEKGVQRVCFFGESVAAGYLYAPHLTPAKVLEDRLNVLADPQRFEVIDLARTNETLSGLARTVTASTQLAPDVLLLFVGNNWNLLETPDICPYSPVPEARAAYANALKKDGLEGVMRLALSKLQEKASTAFAQIAATASEKNIPVVVLVPEVNLCDWPARQPPALLSQQDTRIWFTTYRNGLATSSTWEQAVSAGLELLTLDNGTCPSTFRLLADAWRAAGRPRKAANAYRAEIDSESYASLCFLGSPRATTFSTRFLKQSATRYDWTQVDLPEIFATHTGSPLTDRRLFLDYCHLTLEGIGVAMNAAAGAVLGLDRFGARKINVHELVKIFPRPCLEPEAEATANLGAAIHTAHRLPDAPSKAELLDHWIRKSLEASPGIRTTLLDLVEARTAPLPAILTSAQTRNFASPYRLLIQHGWKYAFCDVQVIQSIIRVLAEVDKQLRDQILDILITQRGIGKEGTELIHPPHYLWEPLERFYPEVMQATPESAFHRSPWPETGFAIICDSETNIHLSLVLRLPESGTVELALGAQPFAELQVGTSWQKHEAIIPQKTLEPGINRLALRWPTTGSDSNQILPRLLSGEQADLHPIFGEIFSLVACSC